MRENVSKRVDEKRRSIEYTCEAKDGRTMNSRGITLPLNEINAYTCINIIRRRKDGERERERDREEMVGVEEDERIGRGVSTHHAPCTKQLSFVLLIVPNSLISTT